MIKIPQDKLLHFSFCFLIAVSLWPFLGWWCAAASVFVGVGKEVYDKLDYGLFSWGDLLADLIGVGVATAVLGISKLLGIL